MNMYVFIVAQIHIMIMNNYHTTDMVMGYTHACLIAYIQCITVGSLSDYLPISLSHVSPANYGLHMS